MSRSIYKAVASLKTWFSVLFYLYYGTTSDRVDPQLGAHVSMGTHAPMGLMYLWGRMHQWDSFAYGDACTNGTHVPKGTHAPMGTHASEGTHFLKRNCTPAENCEKVCYIVQIKN